MRKYLSIHSHKVCDSSQSEPDNKTGIIFTVLDKPGVLLEALKIFEERKINISYLSSKPSKYSVKNKKDIDFFLDLDCNPNEDRMKQAYEKLQKLSNSIKISKPEEVPWFPKNISDLNTTGKITLSGGVELESDHPGFTDEIYKIRRKELAEVSDSYDLGDTKIPDIVYTKEENELWELIYNKLEKLHIKHACKEYNESFEAFKEQNVFTKTEIPQMDKINRFLNKTTNWSYKPVAGLLSQREFLNGLAFRVFYSTQYIRHKKAPLYTPEPDIIHEFLGHAPLFANKDFCQFSQDLGIASLGASDEDVLKLGTIYWFTVEFGVCVERNEKKVYGAGILSSPAEMEFALSDKPEFKEFDLFKIANQQFNITEIQKLYFLAPSFKQMRDDVFRYAESIKKNFNLTYNMDSQTVDIDRKINIIKGI